MLKTVFVKGDENLKLLNEVKAFRLKIWSELIGIEKAKLRFGVEIDAEDLRAWHCVKYDNQKIIASQAFNVTNNQEELVDFCSYERYVKIMRFPLAITNRLVIDSNNKQMGLREEFYNLCLKKAKKLRLLELWGESRQERTQFHSRNNYKDMGPSSDKSIDGDWRILVKKLDE